MTKPISSTQRDLYWENDQGVGREALLETVVRIAKRLDWHGDFVNPWAVWDMKLTGDRWHDILIHTATEELGWPQRFTRARCEARTTSLSRVAATAAVIWTVTAVSVEYVWGSVAGLVVASSILMRIRTSRKRCLDAIIGLLTNAGVEAELEHSPMQAEAVDDRTPASERQKADEHHFDYVAPDESGVVSS